MIFTLEEIYFGRDLLGRDVWTEDSLDLLEELIWRHRILIEKLMEFQSV